MHMPGNWRNYAISYLLGVSKCVCFLGDTCKRKWKHVRNNNAKQKKEITQSGSACLKCKTSIHMDAIEGF